MAPPQDLDNSSPTAKEFPLIQVIEDDSSTRASILATLREKGYPCQAFDSAEAFLSAPKPASKRCVILDHQLPGISGLELQERLVDRSEIVPMVVISGVADVPVAMRFVERGATTILPKPFRPTDLTNAVARSLHLDEIHRRVLDRFDQIGASVEQLSPREKTVLKAIIDGQLNKTIARSLDVSVRTIEGDRAKIVEKFKAETTGEVVGKYAQYSLMTEIGFPTIAVWPVSK